ncbi:MAG TPA: hypothetical protein PLK37_09230 [Terricaulis sp.]|nr:hypothetical protein [Terricaulis sp.]
MHRRTLIAALAGAALPPAAWAQAGGQPQQQSPPRSAPPPINPENELERVFLAALEEEDARPRFRQLLMRSQVVLAMANNAPDSPPLEMTFGQLRPGAIFTSATRMNAVLGPASARRVMTGRAALTRLSGKHVVINFMHTPMLTLDPPDVAAYLAQPA